jgi:hypothetical protein
MSKHEKTFETLESAGLNWSVEKRQLVDPNTGHPVGAWGLFRTDSNYHLGTVGERYELVQNSELTDLMVEACEVVGIETIKGGLFSNGKKVHLQGELADVHINDTIKRYITVLNSHDGTSAITFGTSNVTVGCQNSFWRAYKEMRAMRVVHSSNAQEKLRAMVDSLKQSLEHEALVIQDYKRMADSKTQDFGQVEDLWRTIWDKSFGIKDGDPDMGHVKTKRLHKLADAWEVEQRVHGQSLMSVFQAVTRMTNHTMPRQGKQVDYVAIGQGYHINNTTFDILVDHLNNHGPRIYSLS